METTVPSVNALQSFCLQDAGEGMEAGFVLSSLGSFTTQLHPVLHQVQGLHKNCSTHPEVRQERNQRPAVPALLQPGSKKLQRSGPDKQLRIQEAGVHVCVHQEQCGQKKVQLPSKEHTNHNASGSSLGFKQN